MTMRGDDFLPGLILVEGVIMVMVVMTWDVIVSLTRMGCEGEIC